MAEDRGMKRGLYIVAALIIVALVVGLYKAKADASKAQAHVRQLQTDIADAEADLRELRAEIAQQETPARVERLAREHLDIGDPQEAQPESGLGALPPPRAEKARTP